MTKKVAHKARTHSVLGASSSDRWFNCPGSIKLAETCPRPVAGEAAEEGTAAHELAEKVFKHTPNARFYIGKEKFNGFDVTDEMAEGVQDYVDHVRVIRNELKGELVIEQKFHLAHIHPLLYGTSDAVVKQEFGELHVFDFKYGINPVEVENNPQLLYYALGASHGGDFEKVVLWIAQPRAHHEDGPIRKWELPFRDLVQWSKVLKKAALETQKENAPLKAGDHCKYCPAAGICPELHKKAVSVARTDFESPNFPEVTSLTEMQIAKVIEAKDQLTAWMRSVEEYALQAMQAGDKIPGLKLVRGRGFRDWKNQSEAERILRERVGARAYSKKLLSVSQAEKLLGKDDVKDLFLSMEGRLQVAPESDRRRGVVSAKDDFGSGQIGTTLEEISEYDF